MILHYSVYLVYAKHVYILTVETLLCLVLDSLIPFASAISCSLPTQQKPIKKSMSSNFWTFEGEKFLLERLKKASSRFQFGVLFVLYHAICVQMETEKQNIDPSS